MKVNSYTACQPRLCLSCRELKPISSCAFPAQNPPEPLSLCIKEGSQLLVPIKCRGARLCSPASLSHDTVPVPPSPSHASLGAFSRIPNPMVSLSYLCPPRGFPSWPIYKNGHHAILHLGAMFVSFRKHIIFQVLFMICFSFL